MDIGTEAVKAAAVAKVTGKPVVKAFSLSYFDEFGVFNSRSFRQSVLKKAMAKPLLDVQKEAGLKFKKAIFSLPPDSFKARATSFSLARDIVKKPISHSESKQIHAEALKAAQKEIARNYAKESGISPNHLDFLSTIILQTKIDGYAVENIAGYGGKHLEFRILSVFMPQNYSHDFETVAKELNLEIIKLVHPFENVSQFFSKESAILLDVGGDITQFCLIERGVPTLIGDFKIGGRNFSHALSHALGLSEESGRILKERYSDRDLTEDARKRVDDFCAPVLDEWTCALKEHLTNLMRRKIYIWGGGSRFFDLTEGLRQEQWEVECIPQGQFFNSLLMSYAFKS